MSRQPPRLQTELKPVPVPAGWLQQINVQLRAGQLAHERLEDVLVWLHYDLKHLPPPNAIGTPSESNSETPSDAWFTGWLARLDAAYLMRENPLALILGPPQRPAPFARTVHLGLRRFLSPRYEDTAQTAELESDFAAYFWERSPRWDPARGTVGAYIYQLLREFCSDRRRRETRHRWRFPRLLSFKDGLSPAPSTESSELLEDLHQHLELALRLSSCTSPETEALLRLFARVALRPVQLDGLRPCHGQAPDCPAAVCLSADDRYRSLNDKELYTLLGGCSACSHQRASPEALQRRVNYQANRLLRLLNTSPHTFPEIGIKGLRELLHDFFSRR